MSYQSPWGAVSLPEHFELCRSYGSNLPTLYAGSLSLTAAAELLKLEVPTLRAQAQSGEFPCEGIDGDCVTLNEASYGWLWDRLNQSAGRPTPPFPVQRGRIRMPILAYKGMSAEMLELSIEHSAEVMARRQHARQRKGARR